MGVATMRVPTIFTAIDRFSSVVDKMTGKTVRFTEAAGAASLRTSRQFSSMGTSMLTTGAVMAGGIGLAVDEAMKFEKAMTNVSTLLDSTPESMKAMGDEVLALSKKMPISIADSTDALYDVVSAGVAAGDAMHVLNSASRLGVGGLGTAKEGVDVLTSSLNAFNMKASESEKISNMVFKAVKYGKTTVSGLSESFGTSAALVKNSNVSLAEYLATTAALTTTGMQASRAQTQVASAVTALIKPQKQMQQILTALGAKDIPEFIKKNGGLVGTMELVGKKADEMGILTSKAFGRKEGYSAFLSLLGPLRDKFDMVYKDMTGNVDSLSVAFDKQTKTASAQYQILKNNITTTAIQIGNVLLPRVLGLFQSLSPMVSKLGEWATRNEGLVNTIGTLTMLLLGLGAAAKIIAIVFYGFGKILMIVSAVTQAYTFVSTMAALANVSFATALWGVATALFAVYWPVLLVVAAIGGLAYALSDSTDSMDSFVSKQVGGLSKMDGAWKQSTNVVSSEVAKQNKLRDSLNLPSTKNIAAYIPETKETKVDPNLVNYIKGTLGVSVNPLFTKPITDQEWNNVSSVNKPNEPRKNLVGGTSESQKMDPIKIEVSMAVKDRTNVLQDIVANSNNKGVQIINTSTKK